MHLAPMVSAIDRAKRALVTLNRASRRRKPKTATGQDDEEEQQRRNNKNDVCHVGPLAGNRPSKWRIAATIIRLENKVCFVAPDLSFAQTFLVTDAPSPHRILTISVFEEVP